MNKSSNESFNSAALSDHNFLQPDTGISPIPGTPSTTPAGNTPEQKNETYSFLIGGNSANLGTIIVDDKRYSADVNGAYQGQLSPTIDWTQMFFDIFEEEKKFIWFKTSNGGSVNAPGCFVMEGGTDATPQWVENILTWPDSVSWNGDTSSPSKPDNAD